jgi:tripeptide aminopeptidase
MPGGFMFDINKKHLVKTFSELAKISSPSWKEDGVRDYIMRSLKSISVRLKKFSCGDSYNLLISMDGDKKRKPILFSAHMDTVTPCDRVTPVITDKKISSDGTTILGSDDKAAIAMFLESLYFISRTGMPHGPLEFLFSCAEEVGLCGIKCFDMSILKSKYAFVFDSDGSIGRIVLVAPYHSTMKIAVIGRAAHAGMEPEKGINAINVLSEIITRLPSGRIDNETTVNVGTVSGGRATNIVAEEANCALEVRSIDRKKLLRYESIIRERARTTSAQFGAGCKISRTLEYSGFRIRSVDPIVRIAAEAMERIGIRHQFEISGGGSDTNIFNKAGIRAINISAGMQRVHTTKEFVLISDLINGTRLVLSIINSI